MGLVEVPLRPEDRNATCFGIDPMRSSTCQLPFKGSMNRSAVDKLALPRLPVFGWTTFAAARDSRVACILDRPHRLFTSSGRAAIALALRDLRIGAGDRVLVPTYHCPTMIAPVVAAGAEPLFFPIDAAGTPNLEALAKVDLRRVRAMITAHYFGLPQPMSRLRGYCDEHGIALIEDCAHAMFGEADGKPVGSWGDYAIASLTKFLPTTDGGCLIFAREPASLPRLPRRSAADELKIVANTLELGAQHNGLPGLNRTLATAFDIAGKYRSGRNGAEAAPLGGETANRTAARSLAEFAPASALWCRGSAWSRWIASAAHRQRIVATRQRNYLQLAALSASIPGVRVLWPELPESIVPYVFPLWVASPERSYQRVRRAGIPVFRWDDLWAGVPTIPGDSGIEWAAHVFQLGCHQNLDLDDLALMVDTLRGILAEAEA
jgi:selenocysteine lyase/cysteine desulfurase